VRVWLLRAVWLTLPVTAGQAASDALSGWGDAPRVVATVLLWLAWGAGSVAVLAPRPVGLTVLRAVAPAYAILAVVVAVTDDTGTLAGVGAVAATFLAAMLAADSEIALLAVNSVAYGEERRFPLRIPPGLFLGPLPLARALLAAGIAAGPLLIADEQYVLGAIALVVSVPAVALAARAVHTLSSRWMVLVPAGVVVVDPLTLADPVLFVRALVRTLRSVPGGSAVPVGTADLRLGATLGTLAIVLAEEADLSRSSPGRGGVKTVLADGVLVAVVRRDELLRAAARRRVRVEVV